MPIVINGRSRGFTLVEMSIVLVIIGLIIGGILKGQEVIASARQKAVINQINAVRSATNTYFDRYRALPGDDPSANTALDANVANGDGNGFVGPTTASTANLVANTAGNAGENYQYFNGLVAANLLNGAQETPAATLSAATFGNSALPAAPITGSGMTILYGTHPGSGVGATVRATHWLRLHKGAGGPTSAISPRTLANIDTQIDDGLAGAGGVRGSNTASGTCDNLTAYTVSDDIACIGVFEVTQ